LLRTAKIAATTTSQAKVNTILDLRVLARLIHSILGHGDTSSLAALVACLIVALLHPSLQFTRIALHLLPRDLTALLTTTSTYLITNTTMRRTARGAIEITITIMTMTTEKVHPAQAPMAKETTAMAAVAAAVAVTASEDEADPVLTVAQVVTAPVDIMARPTADLVAVLTVIMGLHTTDSLEVLMATAVPTITADQDDVGLGVVAAHSEHPVLLEGSPGDQTAQHSSKPCSGRCGRHSLPNIHPTRTMLLRRTTRISLPKLTSSTRLLHT
jgi:type IV secretory pathway VirB2 component (pilin)